MILPTKHTNLSESILGLSSYLFDFLKQSPCSIDELCEILEDKTLENYRLYKSHTFDNIVYAVDLLFMMGVVTMDNNGKICLT